MTNYNDTFSVLTGGGTDSLDGIAVATLSDGDFAFGIIGGLHHSYFYDESLSIGANNSPYQIIPDDNGTGTGAWVLSGLQPNFSHVEAKTDVALTLTSGANSVLKFDGKLEDTLNEYNVATGAFVAKNTGRFMICLSARSATVTWAGGNSCYLELQVDSGVYTRSQGFYAHATATIGMNPTMSRKINLVAGETFIPYFWHNRAAGNTTLFTSDTFNWMTIDQIA
jgi:hypothetical protein